MFYGKYILAQIYILTIRIVTIEILQGLFHIPIINNYNGLQQTEFSTISI